MSEEYSKKFYVTAYHCVYESELDGSKERVIKIREKKYSSEKTYKYLKEYKLKASFLYGGFGVAMQGTGRVGPNGDYIHYEGEGGKWVKINDKKEFTEEIKKRYAKLGISEFEGFGNMALSDPQNAKYSTVKEIKGASMRTLSPWYSIAVDPNFIPLGTMGDLVFDGKINEYSRLSFRADDKGGAIKGNRIDVYVGEGKAAIDKWRETGGNSTASVEIEARHAISPMIQKGEPIQFKNVIITRNYGDLEIYRPAKEENDEYIIKSSIKIIGCEFKAKIEFNNIIFKGEINFDDTIFFRDVNLKDTIFDNNVSFDRAKFNDYVYFNNARFRSYASFRKSIASGSVEFSNAKFELEPDFSDSIGTSGSFTFEDVQFLSGANFAGTSGYGDFSGAEFNGNANFAGTSCGSFFGAEFNGNANFAGAELEYAQFGEAKFSRNANFVGAEFESANFSEAKFSGNANFVKAKFVFQADFYAAKFEGDANFSRSQFGRPPSFSRADFNGKVISNDKGIPKKN